MKSSGKNTKNISPRICCTCVSEEYLSNEILNHGKLRICSYCGVKNKTYTLAEMAERIESAFDQHYVRTYDQPTPFEYSMMADNESNYDWERSGEPVVYAIMNAAEIPENAASDIQELLADKYFDFDSAAASIETDYSYGSHYTERSIDDEKWQDEWRSFEKTIKSMARFYSKSGSQLLSSVFDSIDKMSTRDGLSMVADAGPMTEIPSFYRARYFQSVDSLETAIARPDKHIGPPPPSLAKAGRMNAHGISVFYGSNTPDGALAEVRPPVGSKVVIARFDIISPLRLLDLTALDLVSTKGSIFDPDYINRVERAIFLRNLSQRITTPVMPDDEPLEYLTTQAIADFLATENSPPLDGIIFPSVQTDGEALNVVLFHKASRVEEIELPLGTKISSSQGSMNEDGWSYCFDVFEQIPIKSEESAEKQDCLFQNFESNDMDSRDLTLKVDLESVHVHIVKSVKFKSDDYKVSRIRWVKPVEVSISTAETASFDL